ncbi:septal ring lytic transglycosylase RlpA family protein [Acidisphaera sp. S103]|uniref:septal ring lytic transglycosylase RlpA family protein n=1 Tax=Acidisphaera sp. S103 TaxID=1747223 RepID=UPI001C202B8C|nr:septal ring lytic transglycosylase RlpA family protein [Acidisphaera sp. S103]
MNKHFATAFVAVSALLAMTSHDAFARSPSHGVRPAHVREAHVHRTRHVVRAGHSVRTAHGIRTAHVVREAAFHPAVNGDAAAWMGEAGKASFYSQAYNGRRSASGVRFDQESMTAAHAWLPFGTKVRVVLAGTNRSVIVTITDRIYSQHRIVDLSRAAASELGIIQRGLAEVTLNPV